MRPYFCQLLPFDDTPQWSEDFEVIHWSMAGHRLDNRLDTIGHVLKLHFCAPFSFYNNFVKKSKLSSIHVDMPACLYKCIIEF